MPPTTTPTVTSAKISMNSGILNAKAGATESNGSNDTVMISRFATANITMRMASGTRTAMAMNLRMAIASLSVRPGLVPGIHVLLGRQDVDGRVEPGQ